MKLIVACFELFIRFIADYFKQDKAPLLEKSELQKIGLGEFYLKDAIFTGKKMKFIIKDFFSKCDQILSFLRICSHLLMKFLLENFIFCAGFKCFV